MPAPWVLVALLQIAGVVPPSGHRVSSADDCAIMVLAGKEKLGWGSALPSHSFAGNRFAGDGSLTYFVDCDWKALGIVAPQQSLGNDRVRQPAEVFRNSNTLNRMSPRTLMVNPNWSSTISPPEYDSSGMRASTNVSTSRVSSAGRLATQAWTCNFSRDSGRWLLDACTQQPDQNIQLQRIEVR